MSSHHGHDGSHHGHEHNHDHNHAHDHNCDQNHEHNHDCGHDHDHDHEQENLPLQIQEHEDALIASVELPFTGDYADIRKTLATALEDISRWVKEQGGIVGHIKAALSYDEYVVSFSTTGASVSQLEQKSGSCKAAVAVIVFGVDTDSLKGIIQQYLISRVS